eukprot:CAMPEP_0197664746 /NCGR_PEP_ID=MMETSP1338-20131121/58826_1 /TAXON_ID=43686 ORGANISM="Pelagodinium beii, Strain RCC1491" /NCGR_SAMPLE_ID=MMETSP1338 /ASSEMBLY_ACC=CAM_ASM_000754 /LENGTH=158 /DNA_ID=CAMNT_0043243451 /DNA_START=27 /DNA_END=503 /DNA_ORIENTATION=-
MAGWDRAGEDKKYRKDVEQNDNPKHVGEPLRKLTLEDRLELRKQAREHNKKRTVQASLEDEDESDIEVAPKKSKSGSLAEGEQSPDYELDIIQVAANGKEPAAVVDLDDDSAKKRAAIRRARKKKAAAGKAAASPAPSLAPSPAPSPAPESGDVEVLE